jgi:hypothetical protein
MSKEAQVQAKPAASQQPSPGPAQSGLVQRACACGGPGGMSDACDGCNSKKLQALRRVASVESSAAAPPIVHQVLNSEGQPLEASARAFMESGFGYDFSRVRVYTDEKAAESARAVNALAYTLGQKIVFGAGQYTPDSAAGQRVLAHELAHVVQQTSSNGADAGVNTLRVGESGSALEREADAAAERVLSGGRLQSLTESSPSIQRAGGPFIKKVTVNLTPSETATLEWDGTPPSTPGADHFTVSTGKGYSDPGDPRGTCTRTCCSGAATQCAPPYNEPGSVGSCCTPVGTSFYTGTPMTQHGGWNWWTPVEPLHTSMGRGIALHQHDTVTGDAIGHGCIRMEDANAHRIFLYSRGRQTNVTITGAANPVQCTAAQQCGTSTGTTGAVQQSGGQEQLASAELTRPDEELPGSGGGGGPAEAAPPEGVPA